MADYNFFSGLDVSDISLLDVRFRVKPNIETDERTMKIGLGHEIRVSPDDGSRVLLVLSVGVNDDDPDLFEERGFEFAARLSGVFGAEDLEESSERKLFVLVNGLSLLYAEARSYLSQFSSASPLNKVVLPSVNMMEYLKAVEAQDDACDGTDSDLVDD